MYFESYAKTHDLTDRRGRVYDRDAFWYALRQHHLYLKQKNCGRLTIPGRRLVTKTFFRDTIKPCMQHLFSALRAMRPDVIRWEDRKEGPLAQWNHIDWFPFTHTNIPDGFPMPVWCPKHWTLDVAEGRLPRDVRDDAIERRLLHSGKYNTSCFKGHLTIALNGLILGYTGPHLGVDHDMRIWDTTQGELRMDPGEWGFGDLAYEGAARMTVGIKSPSTAADEIWTNFVAWVRSRVEIVIALLKSHGWCQTTFRGRYDTLLVYQEIAVVMTALRIRRNLGKGKCMFDVSGPWAHKFSP